MIEIREVKTKKDLKTFIQVEWTVYKGNKNWVPPLIMDMKVKFDPKKNPLYHHSDIQPFIAFQHGKAVGRIVGIINGNHNKIHNEKTAFFGFFETISDFNVTKALMDAVRDWSKGRGMETLRGPANFSSNDYWGLLINAFDLSPMILTPYNPHYYKDLIEKYGFQKAKDIYAYKLDTHNTNISERVKKVYNVIKDSKDIVIRNLDMKKFNSEVAIIKKIYNDAWEKNWGFIPLTDEEFDHTVKDLKAVVDPKLVFIAEVNGEPAGLSLCLPNVNEALIKINGRLFPFGLFKLLYYAKKIKSGRLFMLGTLKQFRNKGIEAVFYYDTLQEGLRQGWDWGEMSWILEDNVLMRRGIESMGGTIYKTYRIYDYKL